MYFIKERVGRIISELGGYIYPESKRVEDIRSKEGFFKGGEYLSLDMEDWKVFQQGDRWGGKDKFCWFRTVAEIPEAFDGKTVVFRVRTGREGQWDATNPQFLIYVRGKLVQGLDVNHTEILLAERAKAGESYSIALHAYSGSNEGLLDLFTDILVLDEEIEKLYYDLKVPYEVACELADGDKRKIDILNYLNEAVNLLDLRKAHSESFYSSVKTAQRFLEEEFYGKYCGREEMTALCVGHTHIDVAWLWTLAQTREKVQRSFSTVLNIMKKYPEYIFMSSQPQLYKFVKEENPALYEKIKEKVREGCWEPEGAMWLEADCNLSSGESLVRQILFGTRFFREEFGVENKILWLPDVFGYSAALPQILKKAGIDYFMTTKISWNEYNKIPYDTMMWRGLDGTEILTHFVTTREKNFDLNPHVTTYNGILAPAQIMGAWDRYQQKDLSSEVLVSFGYGDGGGGATKEMLENARRMSRGIPGCPKVEIGKSLGFFERLEERASRSSRLPKWVGELYLEYHRGTYTSMARNKKYNRKSEFLYQDAELLSVMSESVSSAIYPKQKLNEGWETILLNQFHDILPGSSIKEVYEDSEKQYKELINEGENLVAAAMENIASKIKLDSLSIVVFNQLSFERSDIVSFDLPEGCEHMELADSQGKTVNSQIIEEQNHSRKIIFFAENVPSKGYKTYTIRKLSGAYEKPEDALKQIKANKQGFSTSFFDIGLDENANIKSIYDKKNKREVLKPSERANVLQAFEDKPHNFDAWDINIYYQEKMWELNQVEDIEVIEEGAVRSAVRIRRCFLDSIIEQTIYVYNDIPRIDFANKIDWKENQILLKAAFPVDIHSDKAAYDIQYGNVERPTHWNTSWDYAKFEVCAHKWADLSEGGYGVSLLNDCKYGYDIKDSTMRLTLLKSASYPNPDADKELHEFTYSLYPHAEDWKSAGTVSMAYSLNCPMYAKMENAHDGNMPSEFSMAKVDKENVIVEVVKKAEDSSHIIVRLYECFNRRANVNLTFFKNLLEVTECDLMENDIEDLPVNGNTFEFTIKPFEIKTFKLKVQ